MTAGFVHLRVHSEYSLADGIIKIKGLCAAAAELGMPAVALTDRANLFGLVKFFQAALAEGVKPIIGVDLNVVEAGEVLGRCTLLAMDLTGYQRLLRLVSSAYLHAEERAAVPLDALLTETEGLIALCGGRLGPIGGLLLRHGGQHEGDLAAAKALAERFAAAYPNRFYLEIARTGRSQEMQHLAGALTLAEALALPVVATNDVCFLKAEDYEAHETRVCIHEGRVLDDPRRERRYSEQQYLRSPAEMAVLFADIPEALSNTVEIARRCSVPLRLGEYFLPNYPVPAEQTLESYLETCAHTGLTERLNRFQGAAPESDYRARLDYELGVINQMGFAGYFLIVMEFIQWAKANEIPVGPGRGSGAGSLVAYVLGITDLDPLHYDLLFERFLNPERVSMPDFDVDFCMEGRDRVIAHVSERYGQDAVSQIITFGTMAAKAVVRDVARVQGKPYSLADKLSKLIPFEVGMTLSKALEVSEELASFIAENEEAAEIMEMAFKLEGIVRNVGRHAGGVVIAPSTLTDFVPLYVDELSGGLVSQFDKDDVEAAGLVKFDFLGLKTLTIIDWAVAAVNAAREPDAPPLVIEEIPLDDTATFELLRRAETTAVFQLESRGMKDLIRRLLPDSIEDIIALVALFRPGPLKSGAVDDYINRKHGRAAVEVPHPKLEQILSGTYGVILYQEQVMQIAQELAGFTLGQADLLRRAMGKKKPEEMAKVREQFLQGTTERNIDADLAGRIFDLMETFAGYAFNKSHSATYALVSFQTAWLKTHHPAEFMAATLSADMQNTDKIVTLIDEVRSMQVQVLTPSVNHSIYRFSATRVDGGPAIRYGLGAVRGVGEGPVSAIVEARESAGAFQDLADFCRRIDNRKANKRVLEALIRSGAMDDFARAEEDQDAVRGRLLAELDTALQGAEQSARDAALGIEDLFGGVTEVRPVAVVNAPPLKKKERLEGEKETLGLYLSGHPIEDYLSELPHFAPVRIVDLRADRDKQSIAGLVVSVRLMRNRRGENMAFLVLDDRSARIEVALFADVYSAAQTKVRPDAVLVIQGDLQQDDFTGALKMRATSVSSIEEARQQFSSRVDLEFDARSIPEDLPERLRRCLEPHRLAESGCEVAVRYAVDCAEGRIRLGRQWRVAPSDDLLHQLRAEFGAERVLLRYPSH